MGGLWGGVFGTPNQKKALGQTQDTREGQCLLAGFRMSWGSHERSGRDYTVGLERMATKAPVCETNSLVKCQNV